MTRFRFLHAADLHLDSPLRGLARYEGAPVERLRVATRAAFENLVRLARDEAVQFLVLAGDVYDGDWPDYNTGLFFHRQLAKLASAGIRTVLLHGNHDAANRMTRRLTPPDGVHVFDSKAPTTIRFEDLGVALHGQSFATQSVTEDLAAGYPEPQPGMVNIGVLHTALEGDARHARYAPCTVTALQQRGYDYWALGHVHERRIVSERPWIVFPGNLQGRHARETGAKGCVSVEVVDGVVQRPVFHALDVARWSSLTIDASDTTREAEFLTSVRAALEQAVVDADDRLLACRITVAGRTELHPSLAANPERFRHEIHNLAVSFGAPIWIERVNLATAAPERAAEFDDGLAELVPGLADGSEVDADCRTATIADFAELLGALPPEIRQELADEDPDLVLVAARDLLRGRLLQPEPES